MNCDCLVYSVPPSVTTEYEGDRRQGSKVPGRLVGGTFLSMPLVPPTAAAARNVMSWYFDFSVNFFFLSFFPLLILMKGVLHGG